jgi:tetratricopeptide (TPR) repeat protein
MGLGLRLALALAAFAPAVLCQESELARAVQAKPRDAAAHSRYGLFLQQQGRSTEAIAHLHSALELNPRSAEYSYNLTLALLQGGRGADALAVLDRFPAPGADTFALRGAVLNELGRAPEAAEALRRAVALDANNPDSLYDLALTLLKIDADAEAATLLERGRVRFPRVGKIHAAAGMVAYLHGRNAEAVRAYEAAVRLEPGAADFFASLGDVYDATGDLTRANAAYTTSLRLDASVAAVHVKLGRNLLKLQRPAEAERTFRAALQRDPAQADAHFQLGKLAAARNEHAAAIEHYRQAVSAMPGLKEAWYQLGISYRRAGDEPQSLAALEQFRKLP